MDVQRRPVLGSVQDLYRDMINEPHAHSVYVYTCVKKLKCYPKRFVQPRNILKPLDLIHRREVPVGQTRHL